MALFRILLGLALLVAGRRLFWLFLGGIGFAFGYALAERTIHGQPYSVILIIALFSGLLGAMIAIFIQKFAVIAGGFFAGGYLLIELLKVLDVRTGDYRWLFFIAGGLAGALLMRVLFGWTLIILSSLTGAVLILQTFHLEQQVAKILLVSLLILGIAIQSGLFRNKSK